MVNITPITNVICILLGQHIRQFTLNEMLKSLDGKKHVNVFSKNIASFLRHQTTLNEPYLNKIL